MPEKQLRELRKVPPEDRGRVLEELREEEAEKPRVIEAPPLALVGAEQEAVPTAVSARKIAAKAKEIKYTRDVGAYMQQLKSNATRHFSEIASILEDLDSHAKKGLASESQLDDAYEHIASLLRAAVKNLPKKYRSQVLG
jgi:hypothetical protein